MYIIITCWMDDNLWLLLNQLKSIVHATGLRSHMVAIESAKVYCPCNWFALPLIAYEYNVEYLLHAVSHVCFL